MKITDPMLLATKRFIKSMTQRDRYDVTCRVTTEVARWRTAMIDQSFPEDVLAASLFTVLWTTIMEAGAEPETVLDFLMQKAIEAC